MAVSLLTNLTLLQKLLDLPVKPTFFLHVSHRFLAFGFFSSSEGSPASEPGDDDCETLNYKDNSKFYIAHSTGINKFFIISNES